MSRRQRKMVRYQRDQARAAQSMAASAAQASQAQAGWYQTQGQIAAAEAEARRVAALPLTCAHCRRQNPPGARACSNCGSLAFLPPDGYPPAPPPPVSPQQRAWTAFRATSTRAQTWSWIVAGVLVLALFGALEGTSTPSTTTATTLAGAPANAPVVLTLSGSADKITPNFTVGDHWTIAYTYDCGQESGSLGLNLDNMAGTFTADPIPLLAVGPRGASSKNEQGAGTYYFQVTSSCPWTLKVTG